MEKPRVTSFLRTDTVRRVGRGRTRQGMNPHPPALQGRGSHQESTSLPSLVQARTTPVRDGWEVLLAGDHRAPLVGGPCGHPPSLAVEERGGRLNEARSARSTGRSLGRPICRRSTFSWWRSTKISMSLEPSSAELVTRRASARAIRERRNSIRACYGSASWKANRSFRPLQAHCCPLCVHEHRRQLPGRERFRRYSPC